MKCLVVMCLWGIILCGEVTAQTVLLSGAVTGQEGGQPLENVMVTILSGMRKQIVGYTFTDLKGHFSMDVTVRDSLHISFSGMGYETYVLPLSWDKHYFEVKLSVRPIDLKEVAVKASRINQRSDTLTYYVVNFSEAQDRTIGDVLRKMPGIEVSKEGEIKYQGLPISKFYIEGMDMLENKYGIATNNISNTSVKSVEILENHQPVKAFEGLSFPENAAINIKLKDDAKSQWIGRLELGGGGTPFLWDGKVFAMRIAPKWQNINTYKTNNCGVNVMDEVNEFTMADILNAKENRFKRIDYIDVKPQSAPELEEKRYLFNKSHLLTTSNGWKLGKDYQLNGQLTYLWNELHADNASRTTYFFEDSTMMVGESEAARSLQNELAGRLTLFANTNKSYLKNSLQGNLRWNKTEVNTSGEFENNQVARIPYYDISDNLELIKRFNQQAITVTSYNQWLRAPQKLTVIRPDNSEYQDVTNSTFFSNTNLNYAAAVYRFVLTMKSGFRFLYRDLDSDLNSDIIDPADMLKNNTISGYFNPYLIPQIEYKSTSFNAGIELPIHYFHYKFREWNENVRLYKDRVISMPALFLNYKVTPMLTCQLRGSIGNKPIDESNSFSGYILRNYRNLQQGVVNYTPDKEKSVSGGITYRNSLRSCFYNLSVTRSWLKTSETPVREFKGDYIIHSYRIQENNRKSWMVSGRYSKGIDRWHGMVSVDFMYLSNRTTMIQNNSRLPYSADWLSVTPKFNARLAKWGNVVYECSFSRNILEVSDVVSSSNRFSQSLLFVIIPVKNMNIKLSGEYYYNELNSTQSKSLFMADAGFTYQFASKWELSGTVSNILDQRSYSYTLYDQLTNYDYRYEIRPRNYMLRMAFTF